MEKHINTAAGGVKIVVAAILAAVAAAGGAYFYSTSTAAPVAADPAKYKNGTYTADGAYGTPGGEESIHVSVTLASGVVTDVQYSGKAHTDVSQNFMNRFGTGYKTQVVGKYIDAVQMRAVSGASLTPKGFMTALTAIKAQAKS